MNTSGNSPNVWRQRNRIAAADEKAVMLVIAFFILVVSGGRNQYKKISLTNEMFELLLVSFVSKHPEVFQNSLVDYTCVVYNTNSRASLSIPMYTQMQS